MVLSVAAFVSGDMRNGLVRSDAIRAEALRRCYEIDGYEVLPRDEKNRVYDRVRAEVEAEFEKEM